MRPGYTISTQSAPPPRTTPTNTGTWFVVGAFGQGPTTPKLVTSLQQAQSIFGGRGTYAATAVDSLETFFKEGGAQAYVARVVGPAAAKATITLKDAGAVNALIVNAIGPGTYANGYQIVVSGYNGAAYATTAFQITVLDASGNTLEQSGLLTSDADAVSYGATSAVITITQTTSTLSPVAGTFVLISGTDDTASISTTQYTNALALFTADLGPGQVSVPGVTTTAVQTAVFNHANGFNRVAVCDMADTAVAATLTAAAATIRALPSNAARAGSLWAPWIDIAPLPGTTANRAVPPCAFAAAKMSLVDATANANVPAAGINGICASGVNLHATFIDSDRTALNLAGVNVIKSVFGQFRIYGFRTVVDWNLDPLYWQLANVRLDMAITAQAQNILENYVFSVIDGQGLDIAHFGAELAAMLSTFYQQGALYGAVASQAFAVDVSPAVNTPALIAMGQLSANISLRRSPMAEMVQLNIVRQPITASV